MTNVKVLNNERGFFKFILIILVLASILFVGFKFGVPYYRYSAFKTDTKELARISVGNADRTREQIFERAQELRLPLEEEDIEVTKTTNGMRVQTSWSETVDILGLYQKKLNFSVDVEE